MNTSMGLVAVTVCKGYADFLAETIPYNRSQFDYWVVVTSKDDADTKRLCDSWGIHVVQTDVMTGNGGFNKAAGINEGLKVLDKRAWVAHVDADIALPPHARKVLNELDLDPKMLYGIDRHDMVGQKVWGKQVVKPKIQYEDRTYVHTDSYPVSTRFVMADHGGYIPIGFFQLWNPAASGVYDYVDKGRSAANSDTWFAIRWPRSRRALIPEIVAYHLESEDAPLGANWNGRKTIPFDQPVPWYRPICWWIWKRHHKHKRPVYHQCPPDTQHLPA